MGDAIFSRFNDIIEYKNLSIESIDLIINKTIEEELNNLNEEYKEILNIENIKQKYFGEKEIMKTLKNARAIKNQIRYILGFEIELINQTRILAN